MDTIRDGAQGVYGGGGGSVRGVSTDRDPLGVICRDVFQIIHSIVI